MERAGIIIEEKAETAVVLMQRHVACEKCGRCGIMSSSNKRDHRVEVLNPIKARIGQRVLIETDDRRMIFVAFMLYMVPLAGLVTGILLWPLAAAFLGLTGSQDLPAVGVGFALMTLIYFGIRSWDRRAAQTTRYKPVITELAPDPETSAES